MKRTSPETKTTSTKPHETKAKKDHGRRRQTSPRKVVDTQLTSVLWDFITEAENEITWLNDLWQSLEEAQFSLANGIICKTMMAKPDNNEDRITILDAMDKNDERWNKQKEIVEEHEERWKQRLEKMKTTLKETMGKTSNEDELSQ